MSNVETIRMLLNALGEVTSNGEWTEGEQCGDWRISREVYDMAVDAYKAAEKSLP